MAKFPWKWRTDPEAIRYQLRHEIERSEDAFLRALILLMRQRNRALQRGRVDIATALDERIQRLMRHEQWATSESLRHVLESRSSSAQPVPKSQRPLYITGSMFLLDCYTYLMQDDPGPRRRDLTSEPEWACAITGLRIGHIRTLERLIPVKIAYQSAGGVRLSVEGLQDVLFRLHDFGHALHAVFHSHRLRGSGGARPSAIDLRTQEHVLESAYPAIQAIFTEDGYVRFFAYKRDFEIEIDGKGVERVEDKLYRLQQVGDQSLAMATHPALSVA